MEQLFEAIQQSTGMTPEEVNLSAPFARMETIKKGAFLIREGEQVEDVSVVVSGLLRLYYLFQDQERTMLFFKEGQFVTDLFSFLTQTTSIRPIQAIEDTVVVSISRENLQTLFEQSHAWERAGRIMAEKSYVYSVMHANRLLHDAPETRYHTFWQEHPDLVQRIPQYMIASYLQMTPETLSRVKRRVMANPDSDYQSVHGSVHQP